MNSHESTCGCVICTYMRQGMSYQEAMDLLYEREQNHIAEHGFYIHFVTDDSTLPFGVNAHTHGLEETYNHPDLQIVAPIPTDLAHAIFWGFANRIKKGEKFKPNQEVCGIIQKFKVLLVYAEETGRQVLRIILPDKFGYLEPTMMEHQFYLQFPERVGK